MRAYPTSQSCKGQGSWQLNPAEGWRSAVLWAMRGLGSPVLPEVLACSPQSWEPSGRLRKQCPAPPSGSPGRTALGILVDRCTPRPPGLGSALWHVALPHPCGCWRSWKREASWDSWLSPEEAGMKGSLSEGRAVKSRSAPRLAELRPPTWSRRAARRRRPGS